LRFISIALIFIFILSVFAYSTPRQRVYKEFIKSKESIWMGPDTKKAVTLTFDDGPSDEGPNPANCILLLDILDKYGVKATFFIVGKQAEMHPDMIMRMHDSGHEVANHTYSHMAASEMSKGEALADIQRCSAVIYEITGVQPKYFRPPGGDNNDDLSLGISKMGLKKVFWSLNPSDYVTVDSVIENVEEYKATSIKLADEVIQRASNGEIIILHNGSEQTIQALPVIIEGLKKAGFGFVTLSDLLEENN
jgi:peptidoglycan/xylan/chitin deacetylase (PgdA/CDA1 family)